MAYNNAFYQQYPNYNYQQYPQQAPYQPQIQAQYQQPNNIPMQQQQTIPAHKFDIVQGRLAADMYQTENGQEVVLFDMDNPCVYKKKRGADGKLSPMEIYDLVLREENPGVKNFDNYVKKDQLEEIISNAVKDEVERKLSEMTLKPSTKKKSED